MYSLGMPPNWWWMHAESSELRFPFTGPFGARRWLGHQIQLRHKHCLRRFSVGVWFFLGNRFPNVLFALSNDVYLYNAHGFPVNACGGYVPDLGADPYMEWASRSRVFVGLVGALGKHRVPSIQIGGILKLLRKKKLSQKEGHFWKYNFAIFQIWCDLTWFDVICRCLCGMENAAHYHHNRWFAVLHK